MTIDEATVVVFDTETTGVEDDAELLEVGAVNLRDGSSWRSLARPTRPIPPEASGIHHIVDADVADAPERKVVLAALDAFVPANAAVVAHNAPFDLRIVAPSLSDRKAIDTLRLARHLLPDLPSYKNAALWYYLGGHKITAQLHGAIADVTVTRFVFEQLIERYRAWAREKCNAEQLARSEEIDSLLAFIVRPIVMKRWPMGPEDAKGKLLAEVDRGLLQWALRKADVDADLRWNVERELQRRAA